MSFPRLAAAAAALLLSTGVARAGEVLDRVKSSGVLTCALSREDEDYSKLQTHGDLTQFGGDVCRAVAAAVLGDAGKARFLQMPDAAHGLAALQAGSADVMVGATPEATSAARYGVAYGPVLLHDGEGFLVAKQAHMTSPRDLAGKQVCFISETSNETDLQTVLRGQGIDYLAFPFEETGEMAAALIAGRCAAISTDVTALADMRSGFHAYADEFEILPQTITNDPFAPAYSRRDPQWAAVVDAVADALIQAEANGITAANAGAIAKRTENERVRLLLGATPDVGLALGLDRHWALRAIEAAGNYGEIYDRDVGENSPLKLARGRNALWTRGGLLTAPPIQ